MRTEAETGMPRRFNLLRLRKPSSNQLERKVGQEKPELVLVTYIATDPERSFTYQGTLRERKLPLFEKQYRAGPDGKVIRDEVKNGEYVYEYELVHPKSKQPQFFHSSMEVYDSGQIPYSETPEGRRANSRFKRDIAVLVNGIVIFLDFSLIFKASYAYGPSSTDLLYLPAGITLFFLVFTYYLQRRMRGHTLVRNPVMLEIAGSPEYRFAIPVNGNRRYTDELRRLGKLDTDTLERISTVLTNTNAEETSVNRTKLEIQEGVITSLRLALEKERQKRADAVTRGFEVVTKLPTWSKVTMVSLALGVVGVALFFLFG